MTTQEIITLFLASPGDVNPERAIVRKVVNEFNDSIGRSHGLRVEVNGWETNARPAWGKDGQAIINEQIADMKNHALFVGIMWNRFGTKTPRAASGTREEYDLALKARSATRGKRPEIMFYFGTAPFAPKSKADNAQKDLVFDFKAEIEKKKKGLYWTFNGPTEFETLFRNHYSSWLNSYIAARRTAPKSRATAVKTLATPAVKPRAPRNVATRSKFHPILLDGDLFLAEKVTESGEKWTLILRPQSPADDRKIRELRRMKQWHRQFSLAYSLQAGQAQIMVEPERTNDGKGDFWTIQINFSPFRQNSIQYGGMDIFEFNQMRADWLLLSKEPDLSAPDNNPNANSWIIQQIKGSGESAEPILPNLWAKLKGDKVQFAALARLVALNRLFEAGVCNYVEELKIGPMSAGKVSVTFRGVDSLYRKGEEIITEVKGMCALTIA